MDKIRRLAIFKPRNPFYVKDDFSINLSAGSLNNTLATDRTSVRNVVDTNSKLSILDGYLSYATGEAGNGDPCVRYPARTRARGLTIMGALLDSAASSYVGFDTDTSGFIQFGGATNGTSLAVLRNGSGTSFNIATNVPGKIQYMAVVCRATGHLLLSKGGIYPDWTLHYINPLGSNATLYPALANGGTTHVGLVDFVRVLKNTILLSPIASDSFNRSNGSIGTSDGAGSEETASTTPAWVDKSGTCTITTNVAKFSALSGGIGVSVVETNTADVLCEVVATRTAGNTGMCLRYTDANNYITCHHNGTNIQVIEVVTGTPNTLIDTAATYGATNIMTISLLGNKVRAFYGAAAIGSEATTAVLSGTQHGIYTTDLNATFNNFTAWAKGSNGEYIQLDQHRPTPRLDLYYAPKAAAALTTPTYDGSGECTHPDVYDAGEGNAWNGYRYWMVMTPFPDGDATKENPSILVSSNKTTWTVPAGGTNPVAGPPASGFYADPDITVTNGVMYIIFKHQALVKETHSPDGITWSAPTTIITLSEETELISPTIIYDGTQFVMFGMNTISDAVVTRRTCPTLTGTWSDPVTVTMPITGMWHIDVHADSGRLYAFVNATNKGWFAESYDNGLTWNAMTTHVLNLGTSADWDENIYRGCIIKRNGYFDIWYGGINYTAAIPNVWKIGYTKIIY